MPDPPEKPPEKPSPWTPEMVRAIIDGLRPLGERWMALQERRYEHELNLEKATSMRHTYTPPLVTPENFLTNGRGEHLPRGCRTNYS